MKKMKILSILFISLFCFCLNVKAEMSCSYNTPDEKENVEIIMYADRIDIKVNNKIVTDRVIDFGIRSYKSCPAIIYSDDKLTVFDNNTEIESTAAVKSKRTKTLNLNMHCRYRTTDGKDVVEISAYQGHTDIKINNKVVTDRVVDFAIRGYGFCPATIYSDDKLTVFDNNTEIESTAAVNLPRTKTLNLRLSDKNKRCKYEQDNGENTVEIIEYLDRVEVLVNGKVISNGIINFHLRSMKECPEYVYGDSSLNVFDDSNDKNGILVKKFINPSLVSKTEKESENSNKVYCGSGEGKFENIPEKIPELTSFVMNLIQVLVPVILVIFGSIDLFKGIVAGKDDEIAKGRQMFIKRLVVAVIIFLIVIVVKFFISIVADTNKSNIADCIDCFISNDCKEMK